MAMSVSGVVGVSSAHEYVLHGPQREHRWLTPSWVVDNGPGLGIRLLDGPDGSAIVRVGGDLDLAASVELQAVLAQLAHTHRLTVLDLSATRFIDCAGLGVVLHAAATCSARAWSFSVSRDRSVPVRRLIQLVGIGAALAGEEA